MVITHPVHHPYIRLCWTPTHTEQARVNVTMVRVNVTKVTGCGVLYPGVAVENIQIHPPSQDHQLRKSQHRVECWVQQIYENVSFILKNSFKSQSHVRYCSSSNLLTRRRAIISRSVQSRTSKVVDMKICSRSHSYAHTSSIPLVH